jgi:hypothetical protein
MNIGPEISLLKSEGAIYEVPNPNIEITIEK